MASRVYVESAVLGHPRTERLLARLRVKAPVEIEHYGEVFNPRSQNFRLQKSAPGLIVARKIKRRVLAAPQGYGLGGEHNYYFSHMLNCIYDCRYCFLQGMYRSAHQVLFVNYEDFGEGLRRIAAQHATAPVWFYSGYDCDSLASDPLTRFCDYFVPLIAQVDNAWLELRTKSTQVRALLQQEPLARVVCAFSFSDAVSHRRLEHGVPTIERRIDAMRRLQEAGWPVGLRFDPVIYHHDYQTAFVDLLEQIFASIDADRLHSVSLGSFRLTREHFRNVSRIYPDEPLFAQRLELDNGIVAYPREREQEMIGFCESRLLEHVPRRLYHPCEWHG